MNQDTALQQEASVREARLKRRQLLRVFDTPDGREALSFLEARFQTDLPVFQGSPGNYDPLDAMRRDAYREIFLYIRRQLQLAIKEPTEEEKMIDSTDNSMAAPFRGAEGFGAVSPETEALSETAVLTESFPPLLGRTEVLLRIGTPALMS